MDKTVLEQPGDITRPSFTPTPEELAFVSDAWKRFNDMFVIKQEGQALFGGRTLQEVWDEACRDYAVISPEKVDPNDPVQPYTSSIARDEADVYISNLSGALLMPSVIAQNADQEIDRVLGRVSHSLLEWAHWNDGYPSENGNVKFARAVHKQVVEGTVHVLDDVSKDGLASELVPNEEIFIGNFWQPDIQKQPCVIRAKLNVTYEEAEQYLGQFENFKYVVPGFADSWYVQRPVFKDQWQGILQYDRCQIIYIWKALTASELKEQKAKGRIGSSVKRARWYNILVNNIPMLEADNLSPYKDGFLPINKGIFAKTAKAEFYWGNPFPNKIREDKHWLDAWKTLIRYKGKLSVLKPLISLNGNFVDSEITLPSAITPVTEDMDIKTIPGIGDPVSQPDIDLLNMAEKEISRGSAPPIASGQTDSTQTAREAVINASYTQKLMDTFLQEVAALAQARSLPILLRLYQFLPRRDIKKIAVPEQSLPDGRRGTLEIIFEKMPDMTAMDKLRKSSDLWMQERASLENDAPKEMVMINPEYIKEIQFYLRTDSKSATLDSTLLRQQEFMKNAKEVYLLRPDLFNQREVGREILRTNEDDDRLLADEQAQQTTGQGGNPLAPNQQNGTDPFTKMQRPSDPSALPKLPQEGVSMPQMVR